MGYKGVFMKKFIPFLLLLSSLSYAESMKFVTVLSSPVGTFNKLETVDAQPARGTTVNFCTALGTGGQVELRGSQPAVLSKVYLDDSTTLGRTNAGKYSLNNITLRAGGTLNGGQLLGQQLTVTQKASGKAANIYGNTLTVAGAKTVGLNVDNKSIMKGSGSAEQMVWSNEYQQDDACKVGSSYDNCKKQYLLKETRSCSAAASSACTAVGGIFNTTTCSCTCPASKQPTKGQSYTESCPSGQTGSVVYTWNESTCSYSKRSICTVSQQITCITSAQWKSNSVSRPANMPEKCMGEGAWFLGAWATNMVCGNETVHNSGAVTWDKVQDCKPGKYYLYFETYHCKTVGPSSACRDLGYGWWCLKCGTVSNASQCVQKSSLTNMSGHSCSSGGGGKEEFKPADSDSPYIP